MDLLTKVINKGYVWGEFESTVLSREILSKEIARMATFHVLRSFSSIRQLSIERAESAPARLLQEEQQVPHVAMALRYCCFTEGHALHSVPGCP